MIYILLMITVINGYVYKSFLNPIFLQSLLWLIYFFFLALNIDLYDVKIEDTYSFIFYQSVGFSLGGFICALFTR
ncbi:MAG TPA: hypothetical protein VF623_07855, partial [Segetibacter sp.]